MIFNTMGEEFSNFREAHESSQKLEMKIDKLENECQKYRAEAGRYKHEYGVMVKIKRPKSHACGQGQRCMIEMTKTHV